MSPFPLHICLGVTQKHIFYESALLEMRERLRQEEPDDLIQVPLFDAVLTGGLSLD